ncbi:MAG: hypothetical protein ACR2QE_08620 [Acidimicrobiales bacterium]
MYERVGPAAAVVLVWMAAGCSSDPEPAAKPPNLVPVATSTSVALGPPSEVGRLGLTVAASSASADGSISLEAAVVAPTVTVSGVPDGTVALALVAADAATERVHWVVSGLDSEATEIDATALPVGAVEYQNESGEYGWLPVSEQPTSIRIAVLALDATIPATPENAAIAITAFEAVAIDQASVLVHVVADP